MDKNFWRSLSIVLGTIVLGLISYIFYSNTTSTTDTKQMCEYNGWAYEDGASFDSADGCNICTCSNGMVACTERACLEDI